MEDYLKTTKQIYKEYNTSKNGLTNKEAKISKTKYGVNKLLSKNKKTKLSIFISQFKNIMIILLLIVGVLSLIYSIINKSDYLEPLVILGTSILNCFMGYYQESKAEDALGKLKKYSQNYVLVKRNGKIKKINSSSLVVGDYIILEAGNKIPADARIVKSSFAKTDESILTGESLNIDKTEKDIKEECIIANRFNMIYSGTTLVFGNIEAIVVKVGMQSEIGKIASALDEEEEILTPLQIKVEKISKFISIIAFILVTFVLIYSLLTKQTLMNTVMLCISMIVASVPECLPVVITATLSIGVKEMAKEKSIVRNLSAIETLGATNYICTDKTGTLTENKMTIEKIFVDNKYLEDNTLLNNDTLIDIMNYSNNSKLDENSRYTGDSIDVSIMEYLKKINRVQHLKMKLELPFDSDRKMMSRIYEISGKEILYIKGSFEDVIANSKYVLINNKEVNLNNKYKKSFIKNEKEMSDKSLKVLAFGYKKINKKVKKEEDYYKQENEIVLVGLIGFKDPVRADIYKSIQTCKNANIKVIMLTGDNLPAATSIALETGICKSSDECINATEIENLNEKELMKMVKTYKVFARVKPETKLSIVKALQKLGNVVAMSGDGVNDAPAIKLANVGVGMGVSGTDVTKDVSDIILLDDSFNTITVAVKEGRRIYDNVITNILYNLSSNFTEILIIIFGMLTGNIIISAIHVLYIDLVADTIPSITLAFEKESKNIMNKKPNGLNQQIFTKYFTLFLIFSVMIETLVSLLVFYIFESQTLALLSIVINEFVFAYNCRSMKEQIYYRGLFSNKHLNLGIFILMLIQLIVFLTPVGRIFGLEIVTIVDFVIILLMNILTYLIIELIKPILNKIS